MLSHMQDPQAPWGGSLAAMLGKTLHRVEIKQFAEFVEFHATDGTAFYLGNLLSRDGVQLRGDVYLADCAGDPADLLGTPITQAEESRGGDAGEGYFWTFYRISTRKGGVVLRFKDCDSDNLYCRWVDFLMVNTTSHK